MYKTVCNCVNVSSISWKISVNIYLLYISFSDSDVTPSPTKIKIVEEIDVFLRVWYSFELRVTNVTCLNHPSWTETFLWCLSAVASLNYLWQLSHKSKSSVNWHLMVSEFTWIIKSCVTVLTINFNCDKCDQCDVYQPNVTFVIWFTFPSQMLDVTTILHELTPYNVWVYLLH